MIAAANVIGRPNAPSMLEEKRVRIRVPKWCKKACAMIRRGLKKLSYFIGPHILIIAILIAYLFVGSWVFCTIEGWDASASVPLKYVYNISSLETEVRNNTDFVIPNDVNATADLISRVKRSANQTSVTERRGKRKTQHPHQKGWNMFDGILFAYSTITTIGYSDLTPITDGGRVFYIFYAIIGVPICTLVLVDWALFVEEFAIYLCRITSIGRRLIKYDIRRYSSVGVEMIILVPLALIFFILYVILGALLLRLYEDGWTFDDGFYAAFDAVTTIGLGDIRPENYHYYYLTMIYVTIGIAIGSTCLTLVISDIARLIHYAGRKTGDCASKTIYFGSRRVRVHQILHTVAREWGVPEARVKQMIEYRLDTLINDELKNADDDDFIGRIRNRMVESSM